MIVRAGVFAKDDAVHLQGTDSFLRHQHQVSDLEPHLERDFAVLKDGARNARETVPVTPAAVGILTDPVKRTCLQLVNLFLAVTARALDALGPAHVRQKGLAGFFGVKLLIKGVNGFHGIAPFTQVRNVALFRHEYQFQGCIENT